MDLAGAASSPASLYLPLLWGNCKLTNSLLGCISKPNLTVQNWHLSLRFQLCDWDMLGLCFESKSMKYEEMMHLITLISKIIVNQHITM